MGEALGGRGDAGLVHPGLQAGAERVEGVGDDLVDRLAVELPGRVDGDALVLEHGGGDVDRLDVEPGGTGRVAGPVDDLEGLALDGAVPAVTAGVGVPVVGGDDDQPVLGGVGRATVHRLDDLPDQRVHRVDRGGVLGAGAAVAVTGLVDLVEVQHGRVGVAVGEVVGGVRCGLDVVLALVDPQVRRAVEDVVGDRVPGGGDQGGGAGRRRLQPGGEVRVDVELRAREGVVLHAVLVGPDAGGDGRPARAGERGGQRVGVEVARGGQAAGHQRLDVRRVGGQQLVVPSAVDTDHQRLGRLGPVRQTLVRAGGGRGLDTGERQQGRGDRGGGDGGPDGAGHEHRDSQERRRCRTAGPEVSHGPGGRR